MKWGSRWLAGLLLTLLLGCQIIQPAPTLPTLAPDQPPALKLLTAEAGVYQLSASELAANGLPAQDPTRLHLRWRGQEIPFWSTRAAGIQFYAAASTSLYSAANVYWLTAGDANPLANPADAVTGQWLPAPGAPAGVGSVAQHFEENKLYSPAPATGDHWFWLSLSAPSRHVLPLNLEDAATAPAELRLEVWSGTSAGNKIDHQLKASLNGQSVIDERWQGAGRRVISAVLPPQALKAGSSELVLELPGVPGVTAETTWVNWIELAYTRPLQAVAGQLRFAASGQPQTIGGFSGEIGLYEVSDPLHPRRLAAAEGGALQGQAQAGQTLVAADARGLKKPRLERPAMTPDLSAAGLQADWLAIGPADLLEAARALSAQRQKQGLRVFSAPLQAVFDQFGHGFPEPEAIQALLKASRGWSVAPRSVLLLGDASYDPQGFQAPPAANRLPTALVFTQFGGETGSDLPLADLDGDQRPDVALGRIPARTPEQVKILADKILKFEAAPRPLASWRVLGVADGQEDLFARQMRELLALFPAGSPQTTFFPLAGAAQAAQQVQRHFEQDLDLVIYIGHGSLSMWGQDHIFSSEDAAKLQQRERQPVLLQFTCLAGLFTHPKRESLSETLLWLPGAGVTATLAPTSLTLGSDQQLLSRALANALSGGQYASLGAALLAAWRQLPVENPSTLDVLNTFVLLGDPELRLFP